MPFLEYDQRLALAQESLPGSFSPNGFALYMVGIDSLETCRFDVNLNSYGDRLVLTDDPKEACLVGIVYPDEPKRISHLAVFCPEDREQVLHRPRFGARVEAVPLQTFINLAETEGFNPVFLKQV